MVFLLDRLEHKIIQAQAYLSVYIVELFITLYLLAAQGIMAEKFLLPSIIRICKDYGLSKPIGGVLIAVGVAMPELTATMISF